MLWVILNGTFSGTRRLFPRDMEQKPETMVIKKMFNLIQCELFQKEIEIRVRRNKDAHFRKKCLYKCYFLRVVVLPWE